MLTVFPRPLTDSSYGLSDGYAEGRKAMQDCRADLELSNLTVEVPCAQPLAQQFQTVHLGVDAGISPDADDYFRFTVATTGRVTANLREHTFPAASLSVNLMCVRLYLPKEF